MVRGCKAFLTALVLIAGCSIASAQEATIGAGKLEIGGFPGGGTFFVGGNDNNRTRCPPNCRWRSRWHQRFDRSGICDSAERLVGTRDEFELPLSTLRVGILNCWPRLESPSTECWQLGLIRRVFECHFDRVVAGVNHAGESKKQRNNESRFHRSNEKELSHRWRQRM